VFRRNEFGRNVVLGAAEHSMDIRLPGQNEFSPYLPDTKWRFVPYLNSLPAGWVLCSKAYCFFIHYENITVELSRLRQLAWLFAPTKTLLTYHKPYVCKKHDRPCRSASANCSIPCSMLKFKLHALKSLRTQSCRPFIRVTVA
jgi:hypothetical protein